MNMLPPAQRKVSLRLAGGANEIKPMPAESLDSLLARARSLGIPLHHDPQIAALLAGLRLREDVPALLYAAAASVLACVYDAAEEDP
ncbi:MAG: flagellar biosynthesis protein [Xanthomonadaceae bacterium]|nr:flagellar biosynthesis protein [Xanthomonadaceae bacterium]